MNYKYQNGAALIVVLSLLSISLMVGLSSMQSSQIDERLAGNYKAASQAQMSAEYGASYAFAELKKDKDFFSSNSSDEECDAFVVPGDSEAERRGVDSSVGWYSLEEGDLGDGYKADVIGCKYAGRRHYVSWGRVLDFSDTLIAERFVLFSSSGGNTWPPDLDEYFPGVIDSDDLNALSSEALLVGGALVRNGGGEVLGPEPRSNLPDWYNEVPDPGGVIDWVRNQAEEGSPLVSESCDGGGVGGNARIVFCDGDFVGELHSDMNEVFVVASGNIGNWTPGNQRVSINGDADVYLISGGAMNVSGFGNNEIAGGLWAGGSVSVNGRSNFCGSVVVRGAANFNGRSDFDIESDGCVPGSSGSGEGGPIWRPL